ncbi:MAG TPA: hypothetical protein VKU84_05145, partial [Stellaceae bacterium]|nr:hypothetical protein [Stellaceae bacterium]
LSALSIAAAWTHLFGVLMAAVFFFVLVATSVLTRRRIVLVTTAAAVTAVAVTIWPLAHLGSMGEVASEHWFIPFSRESLITETKWLAHLAFGHRISVAALAGLTTVTLAYSWDRALSSKEVLCLSLALFFGLVLALSLAVPIYYARYLIILLPPIYMLAVDAIGDAMVRLRLGSSWLQFGIVLVLAPGMIWAWPVMEPPQREDWRAPAKLINETAECAGAPIFTVAAGRDSGDSAALYGHYLDPALRIEVTPIEPGKPLDGATLARVWRSPCAVKVWGAHIAPWQLSGLAAEFAGLPPGFQILPFRNGFILRAASATEVAGDEIEPAARDAGQAGR